MEINDKKSDNLKAPGKQKTNLSSPFGTDKVTEKANFNEEKIRKQLKKIIPKEDYYLIDYIINDKEKFFPNSLTNEVGVFRYGGGKLLAIIHGKKDGFSISNYIIKIAVKDGMEVMSHNHINGLIIPSEKDIATLPLLQSKYNPIYSPDKMGLLINNNVSLNKNNKELIFNKYAKFMRDKELEIEKLYPEKASYIRSNFSGEELKDKLKKDLYRSYFAKNQESSAKEINKMFKENNFELKLYIL